MLQQLNRLNEQICCRAQIKGDSLNDMLDKFTCIFLAVYIHQISLKCSLGFQMAMAGGDDQVVKTISDDHNDGVMVHRRGVAYISALILLLDSQLICNKLTWHGVHMCVFLNVLPTATHVLRQMSDTVNNISGGTYTRITPVLEIVISRLYTMMHENRRAVYSECWI